MPVLLSFLKPKLNHGLKEVNSRCVCDSLPFTVEASACLRHISAHSAYYWLALQGSVRNSKKKKYRGCAGNVVDRCRETTGLFYLSIFSKNILMFTFFNNAISFDGSKNCSQQLLTLVMGQAISIVVGPAIFLLNGPQHSTFCMLRLSLCMLFRVKTNSDIFILYVWKIWTEYQVCNWCCMRINMNCCKSMTIPFFILPMFSFCIIW